MFSIYFTIALRNLLRHKTYSLITIPGLSVGVAACLLIFLVVQYELSYDTFHANYDRIHKNKFSEQSGVLYVEPAFFDMLDATLPVPPSGTGRCGRRMSIRCNPCIPSNPSYQIVSLPFS